MRLRFSRPDPERFDGQYTTAWIFIGMAIYASLMAWWQPPGMICWFRALSGVPCPTCGSTRALRALLALDPLQAFAWNPLMTLVCFAVGAFVLQALITHWWRLPRPSLELQGRERLLLLILGGLALVANWVYVIRAGV